MQGPVRVGCELSLEERNLAKNYNCKFVLFSINKALQIEMYMLYCAKGLSGVVKIHVKESAQFG